MAGFRTCYDIFECPKPYDGKGDDPLGIGKERRRQAVSCKACCCMSSETKQTAGQEVEINLSELFYLLWSKLITILIVTVFFGGVAFAYSRFFIPKQYRAECKIFVLNRSNEEYLTSSDIYASNAILKDFEILAGSRTVINRVIHDLDLDYDPANPQKASYTYGQLRSEIGVSVPQNARFLFVSVTDRNPNNAKILADKVSDVLVEQIIFIMKSDAFIVDYAVVPGGPASPNVRKYTILGALCGFLLACGIIILRFVTDDTIKTDEDVEKYLSLPVLGSIPLDDSEPKRKRSEYRADLKRARKLYQKTRER